MDLYVERQCVDDLRIGKMERFLMLFDANFEELYKYVSRRVFDEAEVSRIVRLTFLDAFGQAKNTPTDTAYIVWLYSLAKPRVWQFISDNSSNENVVVFLGDAPDFVKARSVMQKLSLEEREILLLKFFEQVSDGDVMVVLGMEDGSIGPKIYRVLKRVHLLLFGDDGGNDTVYFSSITSFFEGLRTKEGFSSFDILKLQVKEELDKKIHLKDFSVDAEILSEKKEFQKRAEETGVVGKGSNDPAKIFVNAVKDMRAEDEINRIREQEKLERSETIMSFIDRWRVLLALVPVAIFLVFFVMFLTRFVDFKVKRGYPTVCETDVLFDGDFSDGEKRAVISNVSDKLCEHFDVEKLVLAKQGDDVLNVSVDIPQWRLDYKFVLYSDKWRIQKYERTFSSDGQSGEV